ncbi:MAG: LysR family transcriptional regulator [marine bacterium B5-7]|nr:MAG: LysR family transcriptional regulator [marine bacterium B5-7]
MPAKLPSLRALQTFDSAARLLSFTKAAQELNITQGAVSAQISKLEDQLGFKLFIRSTRQVSLSEKGVLLGRACHRAFEGISREIDFITEKPTSNILTIAVSTYVTTRWLSQRLGEFLSMEPDVTVRFQHSVNVSNFEITDVDLAIRWGNGNWQGCRVDMWLPMTKRLMCSPRLLEGEHAIRSPRDLTAHTLLRDVPSIDLWDQWLKLAGVDPGRITRSIVLADPVVRIQAAIDAQGVVLADDFVIPDIETSRLVEPFDIEVGGYGYYLLMPDDAVKRDVVSRFRRWLLEQSSDQHVSPLVK